MKRQEFLASKQLQVRLLNIEKRLMHRDRYIIQVVTDKRIDQVRKTYREFQYFNKIVTDKLGITDMVLSKAMMSSNKYKALETYVQKVNSGILIYKKVEQNNVTNNNVNVNVNANNDVNGVNANVSNGVHRNSNSIKPVNQTKTTDFTKANLLVRQLRNYMYTLLYQDQALFVDGVDDSDDQQQSKKTQNNDDNPKMARKMSNASNMSQSRKSKIFPKQKGNFFTKIMVNSKQQQKQINSSNQPLTQTANQLTGHTGHNHVLGQQPVQQGAGWNFLPNILKFKRPGSLQLSSNQSIKTILKKTINCWIKRPNKFQKRNRDIIYQPYKWVQYQIKVTDTTIQLVNAQHRIIVVLHSFDVQLSFLHYTKIVIKNSIDQQPLEIRLDLINSEDQQIYQKYLAIYTILKQTSLKVGGLQIYNKIRIRLTLKKNVKDLVPTTNINPNNSPSTNPIKQISIKINHGDLQAQVKNSISTIVNLGFEQFVDIDLPIINNYGIIEFYFSQVKNGGFLPNIGLMQTYSSIKIPVQTIYDYTYNYNKPQVKHYQAKFKLIQLKNTRASLFMDYKCLGSYQSYCAYSDHDIFQGQQQIPQFSRDQFRMHMNRLKRIIWTAEQYFGKFKDIRNFTYPNLSITCYILMIVFSLMYDNNNMHILYVTLLLLLFIYNSPGYSIYLPDLIVLLFPPKSNRRAIPQLISIWLYKPNPLMIYQYSKSNQRLLKQSFLKHFELTRKNKRSIYKKYKRFTELLYRCQNLALIIVSVIQKCKNIVVWYHYDKTKLIFQGLLVLLVLFLFVPFRFIMVFVILSMAKKGRKHHEKTQTLNKIIMTQLIKIVISENQMEYMKQYMRETSKPLDYANPQTRQFFKKCKQAVGQWLSVTYNQQKVIHNSPTLGDFIKNVAKSKVSFLIKQQICKKYKFSMQWSKSDQKAVRLLKKIYGFIITVPSDKLIMGVKTVSGDDDQQDQREEGAGDMGALLEF